MNTTLPTILHIDFDSFFASCEQHFNPNLRKKPIGITAENGRNAVIAASREAKAFGIKSPTTTWDAKRLCPEIVFVKAEFERYLEITKKFITLSTEYSPTVEVFSLDEVFIDMSQTLHLYAPKGVDYVVENFKKRLREEIGPTITVSVGASHNKLLAKLASGLSKPDGYAAITKDNLDEVYAATKLTDVCGIGERLQRRLNFMGIYTLLQLRDCPLYLLKAEFGNVCSQNLKRIALGHDPSPVVSFTDDSDIKSASRNYCLPHNEYSQKKILQTLFELSEEVAIKLRRMKKRTRTVGLSLRGEESRGGIKSIEQYVNTAQDVFAVCKRLYDEWEWNYMVRQISIWTGNLIDENSATIPLFEDPTREKLARIVDTINDKLGHHTIRSGYVMDSKPLHTKPNGFFTDKYQRRELRHLSP